MSKINLDFETIFDLTSPPLDVCPYCGNIEFYIKQYCKGNIIYRMRLDGKEADNATMYDSVSFKDTSYFAFCSGCNKRLFKYR